MLGSWVRAPGGSRKREFRKKFSLFLFARTQDHGRTSRASLQLSFFRLLGFGTETWIGEAVRRWGDSMKRHRDWAEIHFCVWRALRKCVKKRSGHRIFSEEKQKCREERRLWMKRRPSTSSGIVLALRCGLGISTSSMTALAFDKLRDRIEVETIYPHSGLFYTIGRSLRG